MWLAAALAPICGKADEQFGPFIAEKTFLPGDPIDEPL